MPEISRFYGIKIYIFYNDHAPPHFHVIYGEHKALIDINALSIISGTLPPRALGMVIEWASTHQKELLEDWKKAENNEKLSKIDPLF